MNAGTIWRLKNRKLRTLEPHVHYLNLQEVIYHISQVEIMISTTLFLETTNNNGLNTVVIAN